MDLTQEALQTLLQANNQPISTAIDLNEVAAGKLPVLHTPEGYKTEILQDLEKHLPHPLRKKGNATLHDADSFIWYLKEHGEAARTRIYMQADFVAGEVSFNAILNDNTQGQSNWRDFTATFAPEKSVEWNRWTKQNGKSMNQLEFASWLEDNIADIACVDGMPTATQLMEMALAFEVTSDKKFKSATRLQSGGISMEYIDQEDSATRAKMQTFERFSLGLPVLLGGDAYRIDARLKYRIRDGALALWYELSRPDKVLQAAVKDLVEKIRTEAEFPLLAGKPR